MKTVLILRFFALFLWVSISASAIIFDNQSDKDATFWIEVIKQPGAKQIAVPAKKNVDESLEKFLEHAPVDAKLWIFIRKNKKAPYRDRYCSPTLKVKDLLGSGNRFKISYSGRECKVVNQKK